MFSASALQTSHFCSLVSAVQSSIVHDKMLHIMSDTAHWQHLQSAISCCSASINRIQHLAVSAADLMP